MSAFTHRFSITQDHRAGWFVPVFPVQCDPEPCKSSFILFSVTILRLLERNLTLLCCHGWILKLPRIIDLTDISLRFIAVPVFASVLFGVCSRNDF